MGKGDIKTKRGKIINGSYGVRRPRKKVEATPAPKPKAKKTTKKASSKKAKAEA
ncbi:MAG: 30S ribosomal protein THX [Flavobacteriales bacterium]|nr:30S ribosomal protein THX [Flavobacteriales bacterium]